MTQLPQSRTYKFDSQRDAWLAPESFATTLLLLFADRYGPEALTWHPGTIAAELTDDLQRPLPPANFDRLMAAIAIVTQDTFYTSLPDFITICNVLSGATYNPALWDPADSAECAWGLVESTIIYPSDSPKVLSDEICAYVAEVLKAEGLVTPPDILRMVVADAPPAAMPDFADDPVMFESIYKFEASKTEAVNQLVRDGIVALDQQLRSLPLQNGKGAGIVRKALAPAAD